MGSEMCIRDRKSLWHLKRWPMSSNEYKEAEEINGEGRWEEACSLRVTNIIDKKKYLVLVDFDFSYIMKTSDISFSKELLVEYHIALKQEKLFVVLDNKGSNKSYFIVLNNRSVDVQDALDNPDMLCKVKCNLYEM